MTTPFQIHRRALEDAAKEGIDWDNGKGILVRSREEAVIDAYLTSLAAHGYKVTPREQTEFMEYVAVRSAADWPDMWDVFKWPPSEEK